MSRVRIGTSGWTYDEWRGPFYPKDLAKKDWLRFVASRFASAEINGSFYRTQAAAREFERAGPSGKHRPEYQKPGLPTGPLICRTSTPTQRGSAAPGASHE